MKQPVIALILCAAVPLALAAGTPPGEKWKITSNVQMEGMSMPSSTAEICKQPGDDSVPVKADSNCKVYDVTRSGNVQSFKMRCTGKDAMEGSGQFTYVGKDHYQGKLLLKTDGQTMTMASEGQKLGSCDGAEANLKAKEMIAQADEQRAVGAKVQAEQCHEFAAAAVSPDVMKTQCTDAADRKTFCAAVQTHDKFRSLAEAEKSGNESQRPMSESAALCGFSVEKQRAKLCGSAESQGKLGFLKSQCPAEAEQLAKAQCAGRKYTAISNKYRGFCSSYANTSADDEPADIIPAADVTPAGAAKSLLDKSKKSLGGLFGR
jgi:hypothetical protein